ncbi:hypothetical protein PPERSA_03597 [Pseudocohnilembus persalinus]|uniref:Uncharacterized protein n=1 Tax=Pseudocohnilembus persalinus TaxID=266149 RepID=A0A0V0QQX2_PSEPJ|nr:hypothetical protein PPERSA_03597 [Pseudocohnilembus persalinus]|eukprot:KRX04357.1 hypothetical protein PPERSA_03597 [Pseudocohnilembus persalinus]
MNMIPSICETERAQEKKFMFENQIEGGHGFNFILCNGQIFNDQIQELNGQKTQFNNLNINKTKLEQKEKQITEPNTVILTCIYDPELQKINYQLEHRHFSLKTKLLENKKYSFCIIIHNNLKDYQAEQLVNSVQLSKGNVINLPGKKNNKDENGKIKLEKKNIFTNNEPHKYFSTYQHIPDQYEVQREIKKQQHFQNKQKELQIGKLKEFKNSVHHSNKINYDVLKSPQIDPTNLGFNPDIFSKIEERKQKYNIQ